LSTKKGVGGIPPYFCSGGGYKSLYQKFLFSFFLYPPNNLQHANPTQPPPHSVYPDPYTPTTTPEPLDIVYEVADLETEKELLAFMAEKERQQKAGQQKSIERRTEINRRIAEEKKKKQYKSQLLLFDD
jgi:hypothetical protein